MINYLDATSGKDWRVLKQEAESSEEEGEIKMERKKSINKEMSETEPKNGSGSIPIPAVPKNNTPQTLKNSLSASPKLSSSPRQNTRPAQHPALIAMLNHHNNNNNNKNINNKSEQRTNAFSAAEIQQCWEEESNGSYYSSGVNSRASSLSDNKAGEEKDAKADNWDEWVENSEDELSEEQPHLLCLFCRFDSAVTVTALFDHMRTAHRFDFNSFRKQLKLDFYGCVRFINHTRKSVAATTCPHCLFVAASPQTLLQHLTDKQHYAIPASHSCFQNPRSLIPVYEDDDLLRLFDGGDNFSDEDEPIKGAETLQRPPIPSYLAAALQ